MKMEFISKLELFDNRLFYQHIKVPDKIYELYSEMNVVRFICQINNGKVFPCAILSAGIDGKYIIVSNKLKKEHKIEVGDKVSVVLEPDTSKYGMPMPKELEELLIQEPQFELYFERLTPGRQRALIHLVAKLKSTTKRIEKALIISNHLIEEQGTLDFKKLNDSFKKGLNNIF